MQTNAAIATLSSLLATTLDLAGLLVKLATSHLLLQPASLNQLAESSYRLLNRLTIADLQLNHATLSPNPRKNLCSVRYLLAKGSKSLTNPFPPVQWAWDFSRFSGKLSYPARVYIP